MGGSDVSLSGGSLRSAYQANRAFFVAVPGTMQISMLEVLAPLIGMKRLRRLGGSGKKFGSTLFLRLNCFLAFFHSCIDWR